MLLLGSQPNVLSAQQEAEDTHEEEEHHFDNAVAVFVGGATHLGSEGHSNETGPAIGVEYARRVADRLKIGVLAEYAFTDVERDYIFALPLLVHIAKGFVLVAAPGVEFASIEEVGHEEEGSEEQETEFFMRFGAIYEFEFNHWAVGPQVHADLVNGHWVVVYGMGFGIGF
jgi:hypothetical protein